MTVPGFIPGWVGCGVGWWVSPLGWEGRWGSPRRLLMGVRNCTGIYTGLSIGWDGLVVSFLGWERDLDSPGRLLWGLRRYRDLHQVG